MTKNRDESTNLAAMVDNPYSHDQITCFLGQPWPHIFAAIVAVTKGHQAACAEFRALNCQSLDAVKFSFT
ncbi:MAG: hypothetical protein H6631_16750 [Anaerolineaceae bacterium]|nr:hypothetical protein [Anaerolineaceae bacterium]MCB9099631.1 hypothetical protein [Anaerolineales bacterium]